MVYNFSGTGDTGSRWFEVGNVHTRPAQIFSLLAILWMVPAWQEMRGQEEQEDYYKKWLKEDVVYIITPEEKKVFENLSTAEEREQFIEQFWYRRDPNLSTAANEFKEEHYRRIAYANERFASGIPGWMTDRGRIYIIHGPPAEIESHPAGGLYNRPIHEGGGSTSTYPFEKWRYRYVEGIGTDVEIEFVDPTMTGEYRLALRPDEKDALLFVPGVGLTLAEEMGLASKADRPFFSPGTRDQYPLMSQRMKDSPFERYETYVKIQRPQQIKYQDLREIIDVKVSYSNLPFQLRKDYFRLNTQHFLVPLTLEFDNRNLTFHQEHGVQVAKLGVYGIITGITNRVVQEFEDDIVTSFPADQLEQGLLGKSLYQKVIALDKKMRYKLDLVVKDLNSGNVGVTRQAIIPPAYGEEKLSASTLVLSDSIRELGEVPKQDQMFVLGDILVRPRPGQTFPVGQPLGAYFQIYNAAFDQATFQPSLRVHYALWRGGEKIVELEDASGGSVQFYSGQRVVLIQSLPTETLTAGSYQVRVEVEDTIAGQSVAISENFALSPTQEPSSPR